ncbi:ATP-binding protein [uncultured Kriegella sp.]|uniref:hybrid sensor histidine kinase/response regulator transcription factor n=1 Tax=uncultured Kriegella sp. TaxID=1798910 RepID=UPI0030D9035B|tara:strand:+ start:136782 stop:140894 length:4113 start_codon:yes stop_codon:yes gene_type:complete
MKQLRIYFLVLLCHVTCFAQNERATYFHSLNIDGIPFSKKTNVIFEDHLGFLWLGTDSGLYKYDGHSLVENRYDVFDEKSIPNNSINSITEDDQGNLWIGSESYLIYYNRKSNSFRGYYKNNTSKILGKSLDGTIWVNLRNTGIVKVIPDAKEENIAFETQFNYKQKNNIWAKDKQINHFCEDLFGRKWFATPKGILVLDEEYTLNETGFLSNTELLIKTENNTFIAATNEGIFVLGYRKGDFQLEILETYMSFQKKGAIRPEFTSISIEKESGTLWVGNQFGLYRGIREDNLYKFESVSNANTKENSPVENKVNSSIIDSYDNLWIATNKDIKKHIGRASIFKYTAIGENLNNSFAQSLLKENAKEMLLTLNKNGLYRYNLVSNAHTLLLPTEENYSFVKKDFEQKEILVGAGPFLLTSKNYKSGKAPIEFDTIKSFHKSIRDIVTLNKNEIWVGLWGGGIDIISSAKNISEFKYKAISLLLGKNVSVMHLDKSQNIWVGTRGDGLYKINLIEEEIKIFNPDIEKGLSSNAILSLLETEGGNIWIGTRGGGLNFYNAQDHTIRNFGKKEGLISTTVSSIEKDQTGNLWISTRNGISRFDEKEKKFVNFGMEDGVTESYFMFNSYSSDMDGTLYFGCPGGFYTVHTKKYKKVFQVPKTIITNFTILSDQPDGQYLENQGPTKAFSNAEPKQLPYNKNNIAIEFSSLDFTAPTKNEYAYMLEGINDSWHYTKASNRNANYNNLPPGKYTFKVKSSNSDGVWNATPTEFGFEIIPPYWKSNLAYFMYFLLFTICIYIAALLVQRWYKLKKKLVAETVSREKDNEMNRIKMVFFTDISHELRTPLSLILGTIEKVVKEKKFTLSPITSQRIYNNTLRMHRLINQIMDIRKFDEGKFKLQISKNNIVKDISIIKNAFNDFAKIYDIEYKFLSKAEVLKGWYDVDILEKILFNLLSNAFKYTPKQGKIIVSLECTDENDNTLKAMHLKKSTYIKCSVKDNGIGIPKEDLTHIFDRYYQATKKYSNQIPGTGIGMELVHKLVERHHGTIRVESEENVFTEFTFYIPINKNVYHRKERTNSGKPLTKNYIHNSEFQVIEEVASKFNTEPSVITDKKPRVLIVEDNNDLRSMIRDELKEDFNVFEASNGLQGYDQCIEIKPQLIVCDILMPIEDGMSMLKRLKKNEETKTIPIFMLTAKSSEETKIKCLSLGADDYIEKPFSLEFVKWKVKNALLSRKELKAKYSKIITAEPTDIEVASNDERFIKKLVRIIENSMEDNLLSVEYLASEAGMSRAHLYRKLQAINGETPVNFIKKIRLKRAAQLLKKNKMYISEVAYMTGFNNQKYFSKCFAKEFGKSPTNYVKEFATQKQNVTNQSH